MAYEGDPDAEVWERQKGESEQAYEAFTVYLGQPRGRRSVREVARTLSKSGSLIMRWSSEWGWVGRAAAYEQAQDRRLAADLDQQRRDALDRHAQIARLMQSKAIEALRKVDVDRLAQTPGEISRLVDIAAKVERLALIPADADDTIRSR